MTPAALHPRLPARALSLFLRRRAGEGTTPRNHLSARNQRALIRKSIKRAGPVVLVILLAAWLAGGWWEVEWCATPRRAVFLEAGVIWTAHDSKGKATPRFAITRMIDARRRPWQYVWLPEVWSALGLSIIAVPLWLPALPILLATAAAWRLDTLARRRAALLHNLCSSCSYDLTGLTPSTPCPECGARPAGGSA